MQTAILLAQKAEEAHEGVELPFDPIWFGVIAISALVLMLIVTLSWKGISHRH